VVPVGPSDTLHNPKANRQVCPQGRLGWQSVHAVSVERGPTSLSPSQQSFGSLFGTDVELDNVDVQLADGHLLLRDLELNVEVD